MFRALFRALIIFAAAPLLARAEPAMWVIRQNNATVYLLGTVHLLRREAEWDKTKMEKALGESSELWLEVANIDDATAALSLVQKYGIDSAKPLSSKLNSEQKAKLEKSAAQFGVTPILFEQMQPWVVALTFAVLPLQKAGYDPAAGVDRVLKTTAEKKNEPVRGLETAEEQVRYLAELPQNDQIAFLDDTLDDVSKGLALFDEMATAWINGDTKKLDDLIVEEIKSKAPTLYQKLIVERNERWSGKVAELLKTPGTKMIAVGAGHLTGPDSLQVQLTKRGIKAERY